MYVARYIRSRWVGLFNIDFEDLHTVRCIARYVREHNTVQCDMPGWDGMGWDGGSGRTHRT